MTVVVCRISGTLITLAIVESWNAIRLCVSTDGIIRDSACGSMTSRMAWPSVNPLASAACRWPTETD